ncbi:MAG: ABC transporter substrate-binding protein [Pseudobutyrivibrio sp.]|nr:ABC transporter substrate-binding protein [Pseudobutyrivibrio sp.]
MKSFKRLFLILFALFALTACKGRELDNDKSIEDGELSCPLVLTGGSGKASVESPATVVISDGQMEVTLVWSSSNYDYMLVDDIRYDNESQPGENSSFTIPFKEFDQAFTVIGDTTAMSTPHEIEYELTVYSPGNGPETGQDNGHSKEAEGSKNDESYSLGNLKKTASLELKYAREFTLDYYEDDKANAYYFITIGSQGEKAYYLKGAKKPDDISDNVVFLGDIDNTYLVSTSVMDLMAGIDAMDSIAFTGTDIKDWSIDEAKEGLKSGKIEYAGKYSAPDYELLISKGCNLAIENTMINHSPEVKEKLEELGIPVMVERSAYETNPLGRLEWIKLYGHLYEKEDMADAVFDEQEARVEAVIKSQKEGKDIGIFSITSNGAINVRVPNDYISSMVEMAGGSYKPEDLKLDEKSHKSTMNITVEDFFAQCHDVDILIYNATIQEEINSKEELIKKNALLGEFGAVKNGKLYLLTHDYFQKSRDVAGFIEDINKVINGQDQGLIYLKKIE